MDPKDKEAYEGLIRRLSNLCDYQELHITQLKAELERSRAMEQSLSEQLQAGKSQDDT